jgi:hypothetical protein
MTASLRTIAELIVVLGRERVQVVGAAAAIIAQVLLHAREINELPVGSATIDWANGKASLRITQSFEPVRFNV